MEKSPLSVGVLCNGDPHDVRTWSGVPFFISRELSKRFAQVQWVPADTPPFLEFARKCNVLSRRLTGRGFLPWATLGMSRSSSRSVAASLRDMKVDVLLAITVDHQIAFLETDIPIVHHSDTTFAAIEDYYPFFSNLWGWARHAGHEICRQALTRAAASVYPSHWAADSAVKDYDIDPSRVHVVPYGANFDQPPDRDLVLESDRRSTCQLLFIGIDWNRKGGPTAYATMQALRQRGVDAKLVVVGCRPDNVDEEHVTIYPFLDKQQPEQLHLYQQLWLRSSFLCMPSQAETFGAVFAEAAAYGLPVISSLTGGISDAVVHNETGILRPLGTSGEEFASHVADIWQTAGRYEEMVQSARRRFESTLNWSAWVDAVAPLLEAAVTKRRSHEEATS